MKNIFIIIKLKLRELFHIQSPSLYLSRYNKMAGKWMEQGMKSVDDIWLIQEEEIGFDFDTDLSPLNNDGKIDMRYFRGLEFSDVPLKQKKRRQR